MTELENDPCNLCRIKDTVRMLNLAVARIEHAMMDGDESISALTDSFTSLIKSVRAIETSAEQLENSESKTEIQHHSALVGNKSQAAIIAFQFYDRLSQRLHHVSKSLAALTELVSDSERFLDNTQWTDLQETIRSKYTLDADKKMFDDLMDGKTIEEIIQQAELTKADADDDIELF